MSQNHSPENTAFLLSISHPYICRHISYQACCINIVQKESTLTEKSFEADLFICPSFSFIIHKNTISVPLIFIPS